MLAQPCNGEKWVTVPGQPLLGHNTIEEAKAVVHALLDNRVFVLESNKNRNLYRCRCNKHINCPLQMKATLKQGMGYIVEVMGQHSIIDNPKRRKNAAMNINMEATAVQSFGMGVTPGSLTASLTINEIERLGNIGIDFKHMKRPNGGLYGAQRMYHTCLLHA